MYVYPVSQYMYPMLSMYTWWERVCNMFTMRRIRLSVPCLRIAIDNKIVISTTIDLHIWNTTELLFWLCFSLLCRYITKFGALFLGIRRIPSICFLKKSMATAPYPSHSLHCRADAVDSLMAYLLYCHISTTLYYGSNISMGRTCLRYIHKASLIWQHQICSHRTSDTSILSTIFIGH